MPDLDHEPIIERVLRFVQKMIEYSDGLFYIAHQVVNAPLIIAVDLQREDFLMAMLAEPGATRHDLKIISQVFAYMQERIVSIVPPNQLIPYIGDNCFTPPRHAIIDGCTTQLVSAEIYAELIEPIDSRLISFYYRKAMIHLRSVSNQHIPTFQRMVKLICLQINDHAA